MCYDYNKVKKRSAKMRLKKTTLVLMVLMIFSQMIFSASYANNIDFSSILTQSKKDIIQSEKSLKQADADLKKIEAKLKNAKTAWVSGEVVNKTPLIIYGNALGAGDSIYIKDQYILIQSPQNKLSYGKYSGGAIYVGKSVISGNNVVVFKGVTKEQEKLIDQRSTVRAKCEGFRSSIKMLKDMAAIINRYSDEVGTPNTFDSNKPDDIVLPTPSQNAKNDKIPYGAGVYEGELLYGKPNGYGILKWQGVYSYEGMWIDGKYEGIGQLKGEGYSCIGSFKDGLLSGYAIKTYSDGKIEKGTFTQGSLNDKGTIIWPDGTKYVGGFLHGDRKGMGLLINADGGYFFGNFNNDKIEDLGMSVFNNGDRYIGYYRDGFFHGQGVYIWANGNRYIGEWFNNEKSGAGTLYWGNEIASGIWENDELKER